jgi:DNA-directed RNA polymerase specialized sigma24 family protein
VGRRVASADVSDIVQETLVDAISSGDAPEAPDARRRWVHGIARHKVADHFRRLARERPVEWPVCSEPVAESSAVMALELYHWARRELPEAAYAKQTFEVLLREGNGETLEEIARNELLDAAQLRKRVSRLRKYFRQRWAAQLGAAAAALILVFVGISAWDLLDDSAGSGPHGPMDDARELRQAGMEACGRGRWATCLDMLDEAKRLDPAGDARRDVQNTRDQAVGALQTPPLITPSPTEPSSLDGGPIESPTEPHRPIEANPHPHKESSPDGRPSTVPSLPPLPPDVRDAPYPWRKSEPQGPFKAWEGTTPRPAPSGK